MSADYYPTYWNGCNPIHRVESWCYVRKIIRAARKGEKIPPVIIDGDIGNGCLLTGTHRSAANDLMMMMGGEAIIGYITVEDFSDDDLLKYNEFVDNYDSYDDDALNDFLESVENKY